MADVSSSLKDWTTDAGNAGGNYPVGATNISNRLDDNLRQIQATLRAAVASQDTIASASTTDLGTKDAGTLTVSGSTTITSFGTVSAGIRKRLIFSGALTLTHNGTSLILPNGGSNITTAAGDTCEAESLGSGNWRVTNYQRANGNNVANASTFSDGTVSAPGVAFTSDTDTGIYRIGANNIGFAAGGTAFMTANATTVTIPASVSITGGLSVDLGSTSGAASSITIDSQDTSGNNDAGAVTIKGGNAATALYFGGSINLKPGTSASNDRYGAVDAYNVANNAPAVRVNGYGGHLCVVDGDSGGGGVNTPVLTSGGGTSPTVVGSDNAIKITLGSSPGTTPIVFTFAKAFESAPIAIAQYQSDHIALRCVATTTTLTITPAASMTAGHVIDIICIGREAV